MAAADYIREQGVYGGEGNYPGAVMYERDGDAVVRKNACVFGPGRHLLCGVGAARPRWPRR